MTPGDGKARAILHQGGTHLAAHLEVLRLAELEEARARAAWLAARDTVGRARHAALTLAIAAGVDNRVDGARFSDVVDAHRAAPPAAAMVPGVG